MKCGYTYIQMKLCVSQFILQLFDLQQLCRHYPMWVPIHVDFGWRIDRNKTDSIITDCTIWITYSCNAVIKTKQTLHQQSNKAPSTGMSRQLERHLSFHFPIICGIIIITFCVYLNATSTTFSILTFLIKGPTKCYVTMWQHGLKFSTSGI